MGLFRSRKDKPELSPSTQPETAKHESRWHRHKHRNQDEDDEIVELMRPRDTLVKRLSSSPVSSPTGQRRRRSA